MPCWARTLRGGVILLTVMPPVGWCSVRSGAGREIEVRDNGGVVTAGGDGIVIEMVDVPDTPARRPLPPPCDGGQVPHRALRRAVGHRGPSSQRASLLQDAGRARVDLLQQNERRIELAQQRALAHRALGARY